MSQFKLDSLRKEEMLMPALEIAAAIFAGISALSDVISLYKARRKQGRTPTVAEIEQRIDKAEATARAKPTAVRALQNVIDSDVLETIDANIKKEKERLKKSLSDPANDNAAKDKAVDIANSTICAELSRMKRLNGGKLPGPDYEKFWLSHACS